MQHAGSVTHEELNKGGASLGAASEESTKDSMDHIVVAV